MDKQYTRSEQLIIYLDSIDIPEKKIQELINLVDDFGSLLTNFEMYKTKVSKILTDEQINQISTSSQKNLALAINENLTKYNISAVTILSSNYPEKLKELNNPPVILYTKGDQNLLNEENVLAVVGTRKPSFYKHTPSCHSLYKTSAFPWRSFTYRQHCPGNIRCHSFVLIFCDCFQPRNP